MVVFFHNKYKITKVIPDNGFSEYIGRDITASMLDFAAKYQNELLVWCDVDYEADLNIDAIPELFHHHKFLFSFCPSDDYFGSFLGYIEDSPFIKVNKEVRYATWQMSSSVGAVHASVINACGTDLRAENNFDYFLKSFARRAMVNGLLCYSEPKLLSKNIDSKVNEKASLSELFRFTKQHYKTRWVFLLFLNLFLFEKKFALPQLVYSLFFLKRKLNPKQLYQIEMNSDKKIIEKGTIDVLIPTIGRKEYLRNVLNNLASQTYLPKNIIIVEQNPAENSETELDFIRDQRWPFTIKHHFTHQTGACNARNIGLKMVESEFTFFADDDIVFENDLLEKAMETFQSTGNEVFLVSCLLKSQSIKTMPPKQFAVFGAGHAFVKSECFADLEFNMGYEFGFGEDNDFGMQLRNRGFDILFISTSKILHLKAPIGGFRTKPALKWQHEKIQPKPSPTVMLFRILYDTEEQLSNYKTTLFIKNLNKRFFLNPFKYVADFRKKWDKSIFWANELKEQNR